MKKCLEFIYIQILFKQQLTLSDFYFSEYLDNSDIKKDVPQSIEGISEGEKYEMESGKSEYMLVSHQFSIQSVERMLFILLCSLLAAYWLTGRILGPLVRLTDSIQLIDEKNLHERVNISKTTEEVYRLTCSFNGMMDRLEESFVVQKQFAANAAHELKTPLTVMKTSLQV